MLVRPSGLARGELALGRFVIPYAEVGDGARCLVCVNAVQQTMAAWRAFISRFAADARYRLVMFDFPNQGRARIRSGPVGVPLLEQVDVLGAVVDALSPQAPVGLIGGSWGSVIAAAFAATRPSRVSTLILGSFQTRSNARLRAITRRGMRLIERGDLEGLGALFVEGFGGRMREASQQRLRQQFRRLGPDQLRQILIQGQVLLDCGDIDAVVDLRAIRARTLIVNGADDPIVDIDDAWEAAVRIPHSEVRVLPDVGHFLHVERPEIMEVYSAFLARAGRPAEPGIAPRHRLRRAGSAIPIRPTTATSGGPGTAVRIQRP